ncbi:hypothetical protein BHM03_00018386 [Ensete ventricosum]|uniref:Uncharacterized protein n=1 Tax=Ensete ventricosum TaxID=4639 RepID=A0A445MF49_ENSVE|nr:hypothetical protein BHM03_00018386 [Ensete ventricosum]
MFLKTISLRITFEEEPCSKTLVTIFMVMDVPSAYNAIIERPTFNGLKEIEFLTRVGIDEVRNDSQESRQCYLIVVLLPKKAKSKPPYYDPSDSPRPFHTSSRWSSWSRYLLT